MRRQAHKRAYDKLEREGDKWAMILYSGLALAMYRHWNMKKVAVTRLVDVTWDAWKECADDYSHSIIMMCEKETGIEIQNGDGTSWHDVAFLSGKDLGPMTDAQWLYMRQQQIKWVRPSIMACILIGLHRKYGFGYDRCLRIYQQIQEIEDEYKDNQKRICRAALEEVGVDVDDMMHRKRRGETNE